MPKLDDDAYQEGRNAFAAGASLRAIIEQMDEEPDDVKFLASAVGFADALLDALRNRHPAGTATVVIARTEPRFGIT